MSNTVYNIEFTAKADSVQKTIDKLKAEIEALKAKCESASVSTVAKGNLMAGTVQKIFGFLEQKATQAFHELTQEAKQFISMSERFDIPVEQFQKFKKAAEYAGVPIGTLARAFKGLEKTFSEAARNETSEKANVFRAMGFSQDQIREFQANGETAFFILKERLSQMSEETRNAFGQQIFGTAWNQIVSLMKEPTERIKEQFKETGKLASEELMGNREAGIQMNEFWEDFKNSMEPIVPLISLIFNLLKSMFDVVVWVIKQAWNGILGIIGVIQILIGKLANLGDYGEKAMNWLFNPASASKLNAEVDKRIEKRNKDYSSIIKNASERVSNTNDEFNTKMGHNYDSALIASQSAGVTFGLHASGDAAKEYKENIEEAQKAMDEQKGLLEEYHKRKFYLSKKSKDELSELEQQELNMLDAKIQAASEHYKDAQQELEENKRRLAVTTMGNTTEGTEKIKTPKEQLEDYKKEFKEKWGDRKGMEAELEDHKKLASMYDDLVELQEELATFNDKTIERKEKELLLNQKIKELTDESGRLEKKLRLEREREDREIEQANFKSKQKNENEFQKMKRDIMKKNGASDDEIKLEEFYDQVKLLHDYEKEWKNVEAERQKHLGENGYDKRANEARIKFENQSVKGYALLGELMNRNIGFTASEGAKKGLGGGVIQDSFGTLINLQEEGVVYLKSIAEHTSAFKGLDSGTKQIITSVFGAPSGMGQ